MGVVNPNLVEEEVVGGRRRYIQKSVDDFLQALHSNFSSMLTRFRDIAAFVPSMPLFPIPHLVSPKFLHVPLEVGG